MGTTTRVAKVESIILAKHLGFPEHARASLGFLSAVVDVAGEDPLGERAVPRPARDQSCQRRKGHIYRRKTGKIRRTTALGVPIQVLVPIFRAGTTTKGTVGVVEGEDCEDLDSPREEEGRALVAEEGAWRAWL